MFGKKSSFALKKRAHETARRSGTAFYVRKRVQLVITMRWRCGLALLLALVGMAVPAVAQSCDWASGFELAGINGAVFALTVFDDGTGPALYAGGSFTTVGGVSANRIAKWDGRQWSPLGSGMTSKVGALTVFDDGTGPVLYVGGVFTTAGGVSANRIAKWNGTQWSPLGSGMAVARSPEVSALTVFDDGGGPALYAGGNFATAGGRVSSFIAAWRCAMP